MLGFFTRSIATLYPGSLAGKGVEVLLSAGYAVTLSSRSLADEHLEILLLPTCLATLLDHWCGNIISCTRAIFSLKKN